MTYVLRNDDSGFPPSDKMILDTMCDPPSRSALKIESQYENAQKKTALAIRFHALSVGILQATFEICEYMISRIQSHQMTLAHAIQTFSIQSKLSTTKGWIPFLVLRWGATINY